MSALIEEVFTLGCAHFGAAIRKRNWHRLPCYGASFPVHSLLCRTSFKTSSSRAAPDRGKIDFVCRPRQNAQFNKNPINLSLRILPLTDDMTLHSRFRRKLLLVSFLKIHSKQVLHKMSVAFQKFVIRDFFNISCSRLLRPARMRFFFPKITLIHLYFSLRFRLNLIGLLQTPLKFAQSFIILLCIYKCEISCLREFK